jgi:threonine dehydratase
VTYAARQFSMPAIVVVPEFVPQFRIDMIKALGGDVIISGKTIEEANNKVKEYTQDPKYIFIHPFDDTDVINGQATLAYELLQQQPDLDMIMVSIGGGGLIAGIAQYAKSFNPAIKIYGSQTVGADAMAKSLAANKIVTLPAVTSVATSLGATRVADKTFAIVKDQVEKVITVSDADAIRDVKIILEKEKLLVEPASSCNLSAILSGEIPNLAKKKMAIILCGGNFSLGQLKQYL